MVLFNVLLALFGLEAFLNHESVKKITNSVEPDGSSRHFA